MSNQFKPGDWSELKQKALAAADEFGSYDPAEAEIEFMSAISPGVVLALIAENEQLREDHDKQWRLAQSGIQNIEAVLAENAKLSAEAEALREDAERAAYWRQRAKSAEGHLYAGDFYAAAMALHQRTAHASIPWEELSVSQTAKICAATAAVIDAVNARRDVRLPHDAAMGKGGRADG